MRKDSESKMKRKGAKVINMNKYGAKCQACKERDENLVILVDDVTYRICHNCLAPLVTYSLTPKQYHNLVSATCYETAEEAFLLHGDFYTLEGTALQPQDDTWCISLDVFRDKAFLIDHGYGQQLAVRDEFWTMRGDKNEQIELPVKKVEEGKVAE